MLLPVGPLAVPAAVLDEAAAGAARQGGLVALAVGAGAGVVAGGGLLLLGWHGFGRRGEGRGAWETSATPGRNFFDFLLAVNPSLVVDLPMGNSVPVRSATDFGVSFVIEPPRSSEMLGGVYPSDSLIKWAVYL